MKGRARRLPAALNPAVKVLRRAAKAPPGTPSHALLHPAPRTVTPGSACEAGLGNNYQF